MSAPDISKLVLPAAYREQRQHIFPSQASMDWFLRKHRQSLVGAGALLLLTGRWFADPSAFDQYMLNLGKENAQKRAVPEEDLSSTSI